jgi:DNA-binding IclR family transcriptional regulator
VPVVERRPSPPTDRVVGILAGLLAHGPLTAAQIGRQVGIAPATCIAILNSLTDAGYVVRDARTRVYRLGPSLVPLGAAAARDFPLATVSPDIEALHRKVGFPCSVAFATDDAIVLVDQVGGESGPRVGQQIPLAPPFGAIQLAWDDAGRQEAWMQRASPKLTKQERDELSQVLGEIRECGFAISPLDESAARLRFALSEIADQSLSDTVRAQTQQLLAALHGRDYLQRELAGETRIAVNTISAPVFGAKGQPNFVVSLQIGQSDLASNRVRQLCTALLRATQAMTKRIGGIQP